MVGIKNIEMPKSCSECTFKASDYVCGLLDCAFSCNHFKERNYNCPLVQVEEHKIGRWIIDDKEQGRIWHCHCSNCKKDPQDYIGGSENWWLVRLPDYCPNCGSQNKSAITKKQGSSIFIDRTIK